MTLDRPPPPWADLSLPVPSVIALGLFDGVHLGHQAILRRTLAGAKSLALPAGVFSFQNHPRAVLGNGPGGAPGLLVPPQRRADLLRAAGVSEVLMPEFTRAWAETPAETFAREFLAETLRVRHVVVGFNYCFGRRAEGRAKQLQDFGERYHFGVEVVPPFLLDGEEVSSTRIRQTLQSGDIASAKRLLGRPHELSGTVIRGDGRGAQLGFPTANLAPDLPPLLPPGVYAVVVDGAESSNPNPHGHGLFFIGPRRTFGESESVCTYEVHILDYAGDLYGQRLRIGVLGRIRGALKFPGPEALIEQIHKDREACEPFFQEHSPEMSAR